MVPTKTARRARGPLAVAALVIAFVLPSAVEAQTPLVMKAAVRPQTALAAAPPQATSIPPAPACDTPLGMVRLAYPLTRVSQKLAEGAPITIVAVGSSSTAGAGASSPAATYPSRLAVELKQRFPGYVINVLNRGIGGEEVDDMLKRFDTAVVAEKPDLVLWQLGTNSVLRNHPLADHGAAIHVGLEKIRSTGADVVLIDPQYAPKVNAKPDAKQMVKLIASTAKHEDVDLFRRYEVMKRWHETDGLDFTTFVSPDGLHMNDWSYACLARALGIAIAEAAQRPLISAARMSLVP